MGADRISISRIEYCAIGNSGRADRDDLVAKAWADIVNENRFSQGESAGKRTSPGNNFPIGTTAVTKPLDISIVNGNLDLVRITRRTRTARKW